MHPYKKLVNAHPCVSQTLFDLVHPEITAFGLVLCFFNISEPTSFD
ncbi:hypothetical protein M153_13680002352 [Pseudoloma neurophilia]|uniref:Uncharacterized protein n=1 Tax=Pseudoloma neurophilia TaxID=146866 RepID=A0A0R0M1B1_9MICR|nr:hypothetical protein M153_13680002352 [Pseudoloma neurophilia]